MSPILGIWASQISGRLWEPAGAYDALATITVPSGGAASVTFAGIPTGYKHLQLRASMVTSSAAWLATQINGDTSLNYASHALWGNGSGGSASAFGTGTGVATYGYTALFDAATNGSLVMDILDYSNTTKNKTVRVFWGNDRNGAGEVGMNSFFRPAESGAITSINIAAPFSQHSTFALYGIK
jgi:hypothetical protein